MEVIVNKKTSREVIFNVDLDDLLEELTPQLCQALIRRRRVLNEIKKCVQANKDFDIEVITIIKKNPTPDEARIALKDRYKISADAATALLNTRLSNPIWYNYEEKLTELEDSISSLVKHSSR